MYFISPGAARIISALLTLREQVIAPLLAGIADPRIPRTPRHWTEIDRHYQALRLEMMALFADLGRKTVDNGGLQWTDNKCQKGSFQT